MHNHAVIFDLDGVLVDSHEVMRRAFLAAYAETVGPGPAPFEEYERHQGRAFPDIMRIMGLPAAMEEPFVRESYRMEHEVGVYAGVRSMLTELRARSFGLAVATGKSGVRARSLLSTLGLLPLFDVVLGADEAPNPKPAPDLLFRALDEMKIDPANAMMIGDAVNDMLAARGAGVRAVAAMWGTLDAGELLATEPDHVLRHPAELFSLLPAHAA